MQTDKTQTPVTQAMHLQRFSVPYEYPVYFTESLFDPENSVLRDALSRVEPDKRHRCVIFVDEGVIGARASLVTQIESYAREVAPACAAITMLTGILSSSRSVAVQYWTPSAWSRRPPTGESAIYGYRRRCWRKTTPAWA